MKLVTYRLSNGATQAGVLNDGEITPVPGHADVLSILQGGDSAMAAARSAGGSTVALASVKLLAPIPRPPKIICVGLNYRDHAIESNMPIPTTPTIFCKFHTAVLAPGDAIVLPKISTQPDYEAELAFVIGQGGRHIAAGDWERHVAGYMNLNDVSARDIQLATSQWVMGKTFDTFCPMGPALVTRDEIADPHNLDISLTIHGEVLQNSNTRELIFRIPELIAYLSSIFTLEPGDVVSTGTPSGVGFARKPPRYLKEGDDVVVRVAGLGELRNPVVAEK